MDNLIAKYTLDGQIPTLLQFIQGERPDVKDVLPLEGGDFQFVGHSQTVMVQQTIEVMDPETEEMVEQVIEVPEEQEIPLENVAELEALLPLYQPLVAKMTVFRAVSQAREFGNNLISKFAMENILLGITQAGMTSSVRKATAEVMNALQAGSLYDAIDELKAIPVEDKDLVFLTDVRLLQYLNEIEDYLEIPRTVSL